MAIPIINNWRNYYPIPDEGLGSSYERIVLNRFLIELLNEHSYESALEAPAFGFTGISGINLVSLAKRGVQIHLEDHHHDRIRLMQETWNNFQLPVEIRYNADYRTLDYPDNSIDFCFNFSAMWFVKDLRAFITEITRVTKKHILICVPNRSGIGYKGQLKGYSPCVYPELKPHYIDPYSIIYFMQKQGWNLLKQDYIDCPPWPDIGMNKEDFFKNLLPSIATKDESIKKPKQSPLSILPFYKGEDAGFEQKMLNFYPFERLVPNAFKHFWAHHRYMLFGP